MTTAQTPVRIFVGTDRSQMIGVKVFEYSVKRHTKLPVVVTPMLDLGLPVPKDPRQRQRTGFSFSRFAIPRLSGYTGRAVYVDADMMVFKDIEELWTLPFNGAKVICQEELPDHISKSSKMAAPDKRVKQCSVMVLDCENLKWVPEDIIAGLDTDYTYEELMQQLCILEESEVNYNLPIRWNSLEHYDETTCLIHYTDMPTQPWVFADNKNGYLWVNEVRRMLADGSLTMAELKEELELGYLRPSFLTELDMVDDSSKLTAADRRKLADEDSNKGFVKHAALTEARAQFKREIKEFEKSLARGEVQLPPKSSSTRIAPQGGILAKLRRLVAG